MALAFDLDGRGGLLPLSDELFDEPTVRRELQADWFPFDLDRVTGQVVFTDSPLFAGGQQVSGLALQGGLGRSPARVSRLETPAAMRNDAYAQVASHELGHLAGLTHASQSAPMVYEAPGAGRQWRSEDVLTAQAAGVPVQPWAQEALDRWTGRDIVFTEITA